MKKLIVIGAIVLVVGSAAYFFYSREITKLEDMDYTFEGVFIDNISTSNTAMTVLTRITSSSTIEALITNLNLDAYINDVYMGKVINNGSIIIPAKGYSDVSFEIIADNNNIKENALSLIAGAILSKDAMLTLRGTAKIKSAFLTLNTDINYTDSIKSLL